MRKRVFKRKTSMALIAAVCMALPVTVVFSTVVLSDTESVAMEAGFLVALSITGGDVDFGSAIFIATPSAVTDNIQLGTDSGIDHNGVFSAGATGPTVGTVGITAGSNGYAVEILCDFEGVLAEDGGAGRIDINNVEIVVDDSPVAYGAGSACNGTDGAPATTLVLDLGTLDGFLVGGQIDGSTAVSFASGSYSTGNTGGDPINVVVLYP